MSEPDSGQRAEQLFLGAVLYRPDAFFDVADTLTPEMFGIMDHRRIYEAMHACHDRRQRPDYLAVSEELASRKIEYAATILSEISLSTDGEFPTDVDGYAQRVIHHYRRRTVLNASTELIRRLSNDPDTDPVTLAQTILTNVTTLAGEEGGPVLYADVMDAMQERLTLQVQGRWEERLFRTGLHEVDAKIGGGLRDSELCILAGRPGSGKTALALQMVQNGGRRNEPVLMFSGEMSMKSLVERGMAEMTGLPMSVIRKKVLPRDQYDALMRITEAMKGMPVAIDDTAAITTEKMLHRAARFQRQHGLRAIVFDYVELAGNTNKGGEVQRVGEISRDLKRIAMELDVPFVALAQLNRNVEQRTPPIPRMSDLRMSGSLEQDADIVLLLFRADYYVKQDMIPYDPAKAGLADIIIGKQRNGPDGKVTVRFDEASMRFTDLDEPALSQIA